MGKGTRNSTVSGLTSFDNAHFCLGVNHAQDCVIENCILFLTGFELAHRHFTSAYFKEFWQDGGAHQSDNNANLAVMLVFAVASLALSLPGGFDLVRFWYNIPFDRLEKEVAPHSDWLVYLGLATPRLAIRTFSSEPLGTGLWRVRLVVENQGYLPTHGAQKALDQQVSRGVFAELTLPPQARLVESPARQALGELQGRIAQRSTATWWGYAPGTPDRAVADWIVAAPAGTALSVAAFHDRAGRESGRLVLGSSIR